MERKSQVCLIRDVCLVPAASMDTSMDASTWPQVGYFASSTTTLVDVAPLRTLPTSILSSYPFQPRRFAAMNIESSTTGEKLGDDDDDDDDESIEHQMVAYDPGDVMFIVYTSNSCQF